MLHFFGAMLIVLLALVLLIISFFAKVPGGAKWAGFVLLAAVLQFAFGIFGHETPWSGLLHGLNALVLFSVALHGRAQGLDVDRRTSRVHMRTPLSGDPQGPGPAHRRTRPHLGDRRTAGVDVVGQPVAGVVLRHGHGRARLRRGTGRAPRVSTTTWRTCRTARA